jgi:energy-converting hydrogenase Eha subunit E
MDQTQVPFLSLPMAVAVAPGRASAASVALTVAPVVAVLAITQAAAPRRQAKVTTVAPVLDHQLPSVAVVAVALALSAELALARWAATGAMVSLGMASPTRAAEAAVTTTQAVAPVARVEVARALAESTQARELVQPT